MSQERELHELREAVALSYRALCHFGIIQNLSLSLGHVSARIPGTDRIVGTPRGIWRQAGLLTAEDTVINDLDGKVVEAPSPSVHGLGGQISVHLEIYKARPDIGGVIRAHPRYAGLLTVLKKPIVPMMSEGCELFLKPIHVYAGEGDRNYWVGAKSVAQLLEGGGYVVLHRGHGAVVVGETVQQATLNMLILEEQAKANYLAYALAGADHPHLSDEFIRKIMLPRPPEIQQSPRSRGYQMMHDKRRRETPYTITTGGLWEAICAELS